MATTWKAPTWRMPNDKNQNKFENYSVNFNGSDNRIEIPYTELNGATNCTISFWAKINYAADSEPKYPLTLTSGTDYDIMWNFGANGTSLDVYIGNLNFRLDGSFNKDIAEWNHWVLRFDGSQSSDNRTKIYQNGQQLKSQAGWGTATSIPTASHLIIGGRNLGSTAWYYQFPGNISDISIFNYTISETQISSLYNSGSPINPMTLKPAPITYYPLGGNASTGGDPLTATTPNTLSVPNIAVPDASVFEFTPPDYINLGNPEELQITGAITLSLWFNSTTATGGFITKSDGGGYFGNNAQKVFEVGLLSNTLYWIISDGTSSNTLSHSFSSYLDGNWHHLMVTWDGTTNAASMKLFIDGSEVDDNQATISAIQNVANDVVISSKGVAYDYTGKISNVAIWNSDQSLEISNIYNSGVPATTYTNTPTAWYKLDQSANWEADTAGNWQIPDAVSSYPQSFDFNGLRGADGHPKQEIIAPNVPQGQNFTFSCWANFNNPTANLYHPLITVYSGSTSIIQMVKTRSGVTNANQVYFTIRNTSNNQVLVYSNVVPTANEWCHIAGTYDGSNVTIYFNGVAGQSLAQTGDTIASGPIEIGSWYYWNTTYGANFDGQISNVQYFDTALPATGTDSVETLYNNGVPLTTAIASDNLKAWYKLNDNLDLFSGNLPDVMFLPNDYKQNFTNALKIADTAGKSINLASSLDLGTEHTISYWLISPASWGTRAGSIATDGSQNRIYISNGTAYYRASGGTQVYDSNMGWGWYGQAGVWYNFVITRKDGNVNFYNNGSITGSSPHSFTASETLSLKDFLGHSSQWGETIISNVVILDKELTSSEVTTMYNNGNPIYNLSDIPQSSNVKLWWKLNTDPSSNIVDSSGNNQTGVTSNYVSSDLKNIAVGTNSGKTSGMTEQNLVNNNVSILNGESSGMDTSNLVTSTLTRQVPYNSYSLNFDGTDNVDCGDIGLYTPEISFSCWIYPTNNGRFIKYGNSSSAPLLWCLVHDNTKLRIYVNNAYRIFSSCITLNQWHHIAITRTNYNDGKVYVNGVSQGDLIGTAADLTQTGNLIIGDSHNGLINNFSVFNEALTSTEVLKLYNSGVPGDLSSFNPTPVSWWSLGSDSYYNGTSYICPDLISTNNGTSSGMDANALIGDAPNSSANGTSTNMAIDANLTGNAPNSSNNSFSVNMSFDDRETDVPS